MNNAARALRAKPLSPQSEKIRRLRHGQFIRFFRYRYGSKGWHHFPDDSAGREDLWLLMLNTSLAVKEPEKKMECILDIWAPWMQEWERKEIVRHVWGLDLYQRIMSSRAIGESLGLTNAEREALKLWQFKPIDMTDEQLAAHRKVKNNARRKSRRNRSKAEYQATCLEAQKPWEAEGVSRATWYRRRETNRGRNNTILTASITCLTKQAESHMGYQGVSDEAKPLHKRVKRQRTI